MVPDWSDNEYAQLLSRIEALEKRASGPDDGSAAPAPAKILVEAEALEARLPMEAMELGGYSDKGSMPITAGGYGLPTEYEILPYVLMSPRAQEATTALA